MGTNGNTNIKRIAIFDFDGTLISTPQPHEAKIRYEQVTGKVWPHTGFWSKKESLDRDMFDMPVIESVYEAYKKEKATPNTLVVMMTGRIGKLGKIVEKILLENGMEFDEYQYKNGKFGSETLDFKIGMLNEYLERFPELDSIAMWEDRIEHVKAFLEWSDEVVQRTGIEFQMTSVDTRLDLAVQELNMKFGHPKPMQYKILFAVGKYSTTILNCNDGIGWVIEAVGSDKIEELGLTNPKDVPTEIGVYSAIITSIARQVNRIDDPEEWDTEFTISGIKQINKLQL